MRINWKKQKQALDMYKMQFDVQVEKHKRLSLHLENNPRDIESFRNKCLLESRMFYTKTQVNLLTKRAQIAITISA